MSFNFRNYIKFNHLFLALVFLFATASVFSQTTDVLMKAMEDEMNRSLTQLQLKDFGKPYFVEYGISDIEVYSVSAKFGALQGAGFNKSRGATVQVRLGDYDFDNTNLFTTGTMAGGTSLVLDDNYDSIRQDLWLVTDATYKSAVEQLSSKKAYLQNNVVDEKIPDLSREQPVVSIQDREKLTVDSAKWEKFIRELSAIFRKYPEITESSVSMSARLETRYLVNNEGTRLREPTLLISVNVYAETFTSDSLKITPSRHIYARSFDKLPSFEEMTKVVENLAQDVTNVRKAPIFEDTYIGPVLFTDRAAVQLFSQLLAPNLAEERRPLSSRSNETGVLSERINRRILPPNISVEDDPTRSDFNGQHLIGDYKFDAQAVPAKPLNLVENGILKTLLTSRVPTKKYPTSNGRARSAFGKPFISNLLVEAKEGKSFEQLKAELLESCKSQSLPYGIILREIDSTFFMSGSSLSTPILAYKVYVEDGREELVRNISIDDFPIRELRQILAVGNDGVTLNHIFGGQRGAGTPYSVSAPSILMDEIVLRKDTSTKSKPLILTHPYFNK